MQSALRICGFLANQPKFHPCLVESMYSKSSDTGGPLCSPYEVFFVCKELEHPQVLVPSGTPGTIPLWLLRDGCASFRDVAEIWGGR